MKWLMQRELYLLNMSEDHILNMAILSTQTKHGMMFFFKIHPTHA